MEVVVWYILSELGLSIGRVKNMIMILILIYLINDDQRNRLNFRLEFELSRVVSLMDLNNLHVGLK